MLRSIISSGTSSSRSNRPNAAGSDLARQSSSNSVGSQDRMDGRSSRGSRVDNDRHLLPSISGSQGCLSQEDVLTSFHRYLTSACRSAVWNKLLKRSSLEDRDCEVMISIPALTLVEAAIKSDKHQRIPVSWRTKLSLNNCPRELQPLLRRWMALAVEIKAIEMRGQLMDLKKFLTGQTTSSPLPAAMTALAAQINGLAIEITQRRTFQNNLSDDLNEVVEEVSEDESDTEDSTASAAHQPAPSAPPMHTQPSAPPMPAQMVRALAGSAQALPEGPELDAIRETLYAALGDELEANPALMALLATNRPRAISGGTALAMSRVARGQLTHVDGLPAIRMAGSKYLVKTPEAEHANDARFLVCPEGLHALFDVLSNMGPALHAFGPQEEAALHAQLIGVTAPTEGTTWQVLRVANFLTGATDRVVQQPKFATNAEHAFTLLAVLGAGQF